MIGQWVLLDLGESGVDFGVGVLPKMGGTYSTSPGWGTIGIFKSSEHPKEAWLRWKWLVDPSHSLEAYQSGLWMPLMTDWYTDESLLNQWAVVNPAHPGTGILKSGLLYTGNPADCCDRRDFYVDYESGFRTA
jgi:multiple sugar transport system substrate-binding protein